MSSVIVVDAAQLGDTPAAFQQYVAEFFRPAKVLGKDVFVASTILSWNWQYGSGSLKGLAPCHSCDLQRFKDGLAEGVGLNDWMRAANGKCLWEFVGAREPSDGGYDDD